MTNQIGRDFAWALNVLKSGGKISRAGWNGKDQYLHLQMPNDFSKMRHPYIYIRPVNGELVPWVASQTDLLSNDWVKFEHPINNTDGVGSACPDGRNVLIR